MKSKSIQVACLLLLGCAVPGAAVRADVVYSFQHITHFSEANAAMGEAQLSLTVSGYGPDSKQALFTFRNLGSAPCSVAQIFFDDGSLLAAAGILEVAHDFGKLSMVSFQQDADNQMGPHELPGGDRLNPAFITSSYETNGHSRFQKFSAVSASPFGTSFTPDPASPNAGSGGSGVPGAGDGFVDLPLPLPIPGSDSSVGSNGIDPGDSLGIYYDLQNGKTLADVFADLGSGALRIGLSVQGFGDGGSESFLNKDNPGDPPPAVPAPAAVILGIVGLGLVSRAVRRMT